MNEELFVEFKNLKLNKSNLRRFLDELKNIKVYSLELMENILS